MIEEQQAKVKALTAEVRRLQAEVDAEAKRIEEKLRKEFEEVVAYAYKREHTWPNKDPLGQRAYEGGDEALIRYLVEWFSMDEVNEHSPNTVYARALDVDDELLEAKKEGKRLKTTTSNLARDSNQPGWGFRAPAHDHRRRGHE